jgi:hypothetical protein
MIIPTDGRTSVHTLYCIALHCIVLHCIALYYIVLYCIALHCIVLHCIVCIALNALHCILTERNVNSKYGMFTLELLLHVAVYKRLLCSTSSHIHQVSKLCLFFKTLF